MIDSIDKLLIRDFLRMVTRGNLRGECLTDPLMNNPDHLPEPLKWDPIKMGGTQYESRYCC